MKHVREDLPDVQIRRPEVSAGLAAILDRMTDKHLEHRYPDAHTLESDLEDALAVEAARSGRATGEATAVIATLPASARRRVPFRLRRRIPVIAVVGALLLAGGVLAVVLLQGLERTQRGTGEGKVQAPPGTRVVSVKRTSAQDFDPLGDDDEHADEASLAVDKDPGTAWTTESYSGGTLAGKDGVGLYVDAAPGVAATLIELDTPDAGWRVEIHVAEDGPAPDAAPGVGNEWQRVGGGTVKRKRQRFKLRTEDTPYRYYLVWITQLPEGEERVEISDVSLFRRTS
jgi:serine/threonine-protein kinase